MEEIKHIPRFDLRKVIEVTLAGIALSLLAVCLFPVTTPRRSPSTEALSKMKQILTGGIIYCSDYDDLLPPHGHFESDRPSRGPWIKGDHMAWRRTIYSYLKNHEVFFSPSWPFRAQQGQRLVLARGVTNGASCFGYVQEIGEKWFGTEEGHLRLNPSSPPQGFLKSLGVTESEAPLLEDLAWEEKGWFGTIHTHRILEKVKPHKRILGFMNGHAKILPL